MARSVNQWFEWSDEDVDDHVFGSGAMENARWYRNIDVEDATGAYVARMWDPYHDEQERRRFTTYRFTRDDFRRIAQEVADGKHDVDPILRTSLRHDDPDAETVDAVIQLTVYGIVIYS